MTTTLPSIALKNSPAPMITVASRLHNIKASSTLVLAAQTKELQAQGKDIIDLTAGEPDFPTPQHVKEAAIAAINSNFTKYTAIDGIPRLKQAICDKFSRENKLNYTLNQILVSVGAKHSLYNAFQALLNEGDEVIIPAPYWVSYPEMVLLATGKPVIIATSPAQNFKITPQQLAAAITPRTKAIIINSPSNPTGMVYSAKELTEIAAILLKHPNIAVISDDIYEHILWGDSESSQPVFVNILNVCPELYARTLVINGVSKAYAMTGWRIGYAAGAPHIITAMKNIQSQSTSNPTSIAQVAATTALNGDQECIKEMVREFRLRHNLMFTELNKIAGFYVAAAAGAFYMFADVTLAIKSCHCTNDVDFAALLLHKAEVATVPGSAFGAPNHLRFSYTANMSLLREAARRITTVVYT